MTSIIKVFAICVKGGTKTLDDVPKRFRKQVEELLEKEKNNRK